MVHPRYDSPYNDRFISPRLAHLLFFPKSLPHGKKTQWLPYGMPFKDLQTIDDYEESVARFERDYMFVTPDELVRWGEIEADNPNRKRGEPAAINKTENVKAYRDRLIPLLKKSIVGEGKQRGLIFSKKPTQRMGRILMGDGKFPIKFPSAYKHKWIHEELRHEPTKSLKPKVPLLTPFTTPYYKVYRGKGRRKEGDVFNCPHCGNHIVYSRRSAWCPLCDNHIRRFWKNWPYAKRDKPTATERGESKWQKRYQDIHGESTSSYGKSWVEQQYDEIDMRNIADITLGGWKPRNKLQILIPRSLIGKTNYGVINNATIISDRYMLNPKVEWLEEDD